MTESYGFSSGEHVIFERDTESILYLIEKGRVEVIIHSEDSNKQINTLGEGEIIGEISFLTGKLRTADVLTLEESTIRFFEPERLQSLFKENPLLAAHFFYGLSRILSYRFTDTIQKLSEK